MKRMMLNENLALDGGGVHTGHTEINGFNCTMDYPKKGGFADEDMEFPETLKKEHVDGNYRGQLKKKWNFQG